MEDKKIELIVERLIERTEEGKIDWSATADKNTYLAALKDNAISVRHGFIFDLVGQTLSEQFPEAFKDTKTPYIFDFRNENGDVVESVIVSESNGSLFDKAKKVFELAQTQSLKNHPIVDSILDQLAA